MNEWMADGACVGVDPEEFHPEPGDQARAAKNICAGCPVLPECLEYAIRDADLFGIWGGASMDQRRKIRTQLGIRHEYAITHGTYGGYRAHQRRGETPCNACVEANTIHGRNRRTRAAA